MKLTLARMRHKSCFILSPVVATATTDSLRPGIPRSAAAASAQLRRAVQTALVSGKRRMIVDILLADLDPRQRTYDDDGARAIYESLASCGTGTGTETDEGMGTHMVVSGATTAMRVRSWLSSRKKRVSIGILGSAENRNLVTEKDMVCIMVDPEGGIKGLLDLRKVLRQVEKEHDQGMNTKAKAVVICNHPREDYLYEMAGYGGIMPIEMSDYNEVFVLIPFTFQHNMRKNADGSPKMYRFAIMKQFPWNWGFWMFVEPNNENPSEDDDDDTLNNKNSMDRAPSHERNGEYVLCQEFTWRPDDDDIMEAINEAILERASDI